MPGLARLTLGHGQDSYLFQFLCHLRPDRIESFDSRQRRAMLALLEYIRDAMREEVERNCEMKSLERRIRRLQGITTE